MNAFFLILSNMALGGAALALIALLINRLAKHQSITCWLWRFVVIKHLVPPLVSLPLALPLFSDFSQSSETASTLSIADILIWIWASGIIAYGTVAAFRIRKFSKAFSQANLAPLRIQKLGFKIAEDMGLRDCPDIVRTNTNVPPLVYASFPWKPKVLLSARLLDELKDSEISALLTHEFAHVKRYDHYYRWVELLAVTLFWWNPVVWWARRQSREAEELCCDALALESLSTPKNYALAIFRSLELVALKPVAPIPLASGVGYLQSIKSRMQLILDRQLSSKISGTRIILLMIVAILSLPLSMQLGEAKAEPDAQSEANTEWPTPPADTNGASDSGSGDW